MKSCNNEKTNSPDRRIYLIHLMKSPDTLFMCVFQIFSEKEMNYVKIPHKDKTRVCFTSLCF